MEALRPCGLVDPNRFLERYKTFFCEPDIAPAVGFLFPYRWQGVGRAEQQVLIAHIVVCGQGVEDLAYEISMTGLKIRLSGIRRRMIQNADVKHIVESEKISDEDATLLSKDIVKRIEESLTFPGQIKVTVIRETRAVEYANK